MNVLLGTALIFLLVVIGRARAVWPSSSLLKWQLELMIAEYRQGQGFDDAASQRIRELGQSGASMLVELFRNTPDATSRKRRLVSLLMLLVDHEEVLEVLEEARDKTSNRMLEEHVNHALEIHRETQKLFEEKGG